MDKDRIVIFDGFCELCNSSISFLKNNLKNQNYLFIPSKNEEGIKLINKFNLDDIPNRSIIIIKNDKIYLRSDAILAIIDDMTSMWKVFKIFKLFPQSARNWIYDLVAKHRHIIKKSK